MKWFITCHICKTPSISHDDPTSSTAAKKINPLPDPAKISEEETKIQVENQSRTDDHNESKGEKRHNDSTDEKKRTGQMNPEDLILKSIKPFF